MTEKIQLKAVMHKNGRIRISDQDNRTFEAIDESLQIQGVETASIRVDVDIPLPWSLSRPMATVIIRVPLEIEK